MNEQNIDIAGLGPAETLNTMEGVLDLLADAQGRAKCGYIFVMSELVDNLKKIILHPAQPSQAPEFKFEMTPVEPEVKEETAEESKAE